MSGKMDLSEEKPAVTDRLRDPDSLAGQFCGGATGINRENREKKKKKKRFIQAANFQISSCAPANSILHGWHSKRSLLPLRVPFHGDHDHDI